VRYYDIKIQPPPKPGAAPGAATLHYTSYPGGIGGGNSGAALLGAPLTAFGIPGGGTSPYDPGALNIEFDTFVFPAATPMGGSTVRIEGISPALLTNAQQFAGQLLTLRAGMGPGLPLAKPQQAGLILQGQVLQAYGNWQATEINMSFVVYPAIYTLAAPGNIVLNWTAGTTLKSALQTTLAAAYAGVPINISIADTVLSHDEKHVASTLSGLARLLNDIVPGTQIVANGDTIRVFDSTYQPAPKPLLFEDMIGQPMWIRQATIQAKFAMRADIQVGDTIEFPQTSTAMPGFVQTARAAIPSAPNYQSAIKGKFAVQSIRQIGNLRQPSGDAWCTLVIAATLNATPIVKPA